MASTLRAHGPLPVIRVLTDCGASTLRAHGPRVAHVRPLRLARIRRHFRLTLTCAGLIARLWLLHALGILELPLTVGISPDRKAPFVQ